MTSLLAVEAASVLWILAFAREMSDNAAVEAALSACARRTRSSVRVVRVAAVGGIVGLLHLRLLHVWILWLLRRNLCRRTIASDVTRLLTVLANAFVGQRARRGKVADLVATIAVVWLVLACAQRSDVTTLAAFEATSSSIDTVVICVVRRSSVRH